jgi:N-acetylglucosaminyl-diphospho-decaprenol L-rhamnosyltransferase
MINCLLPTNSSFKFSLDIIIVNWNSGSLLRKCLDSLTESKIEDIDLNVIVVDNASIDGSEHYFYPNYITLIKSSQNLGFGKACNLAFKQCKAETLLLLNPDTELNPSTIIGTLLLTQKYPKFDVYGIQQRDAKGNILRTCGRFPDLKSLFFESIGLSKIFPSFFRPAPLMLDWDHSSTKQVDHIMGSYMLIRRNSIPDDLLFDDDYFMYYEDLDLSYRIHKNGGKTLFLSELYLKHEAGGTSSKVLDKRLSYSLYSKILFQSKHFGKTRSIIAVLVIYLFEFPIRILSNFKSVNQINNVIKAYKMLTKNLYLAKK